MIKSIATYIPKYEFHGTPLDSTSSASDQEFLLRETRFMLLVEAIGVIYDEIEHFHSYFQNIDERLYL